MRADQLLQEKLNTWAFWWAEKNKQPTRWHPDGEQERIDRRYSETSEDLIQHIAAHGYEVSE